MRTGHAGAWGCCVRLAARRLPRSARASTTVPRPVCPCVLAACSLKPGVDAISLDWAHTNLYNPDHERVLQHPSVARVLARQAQEEANQTNGLQLSTCLDAFTRAEVLGDDEQWKCETCKVRHVATVRRACVGRWWLATRR